MTAPLSNSVVVPLPTLRSLILAATVDAKTGAVNYPAWRARALAALGTASSEPGGSCC